MSGTVRGSDHDTSNWRVEISSHHVSTGSARAAVTVQDFKDCWCQSVRLNDQSCLYNTMHTERHLCVWGSIHVLGIKDAFTKSWLK